MSNEQDWADWVARLAPAVSAIGTTAAVITSLWLAGRQGRQTSSAQAEQITAWYTPSEEVVQDRPHRLFTAILVNNASQQLVYDLVAQVVGLQGSFRRTAVGDTNERNREFGALIGNVPPGRYATRIDGSGGGMHRRFGIELAFQDAAGRYWLRQGDGVLKRVKKHPADLYNLSRPISWQL
jgi:hypothetical protein